MAGKQKGANLKPRAAGADEKLITPLLVEATVLSLELTGADSIGALKDFRLRSRENSGPCLLPTQMKLFCSPFESKLNRGGC